MPLQHGDPAPRVHIPNLDTRIRTTGGQKLTSRVPRDKCLGGVPQRQISYVRPVPCIINRDDIRRLIPHRNSAAVRIEIQRVNLITGLPSANFFSGVQVEADDPMLLADGDLPAIGTERQP